MSKKLKIPDRLLALLLHPTPALGLEYVWIHNELIATAKCHSLEQSTGSGMLYEPKVNEACLCILLESFAEVIDELPILSDYLDAWLGTSIDIKITGTVARHMTTPLRPVPILMVASVST